jgi:hypothetical protein
MATLSAGPEGTQAVFDSCQSPSHMHGAGDLQVHEPRNVSYIMLLSSCANASTLCVLGLWKVDGRHWDAEADGLLEARLTSLAAVTTLKQLQFKRCKTMGTCCVHWTVRCWLSCTSDVLQKGSEFCTSSCICLSLALRCEHVHSSYMVCQVVISSRISNISTALCSAGAPHHQRSSCPVVAPAGMCIIPMCISIRLRRRLLAGI